MDKQDLQGDIVKVIGTMFKEEKLFYTNLFLAGRAARGGTADDYITLFDPVGCVATRSIGSTGWDGKSISHVFSMDCPTSIVDVVQEKGRADRWNGATADKCMYAVCITLTSYIYLLLRIHLPSNALL